MKKWLMLGAGAMLLAWLPFLYAELTSEPTEAKGRDLPGEEAGDTDEARAVEAEATGGAGEAAEPAADPQPEIVAQAPAAPSGAKPAEGTPAVNAPGEPGATGQLPPGAAPEDGEEAVDPEEVAEGEPEPEPPTASGPVQVLRQAFEHQPRDALWATDTEHKLRALFGTADVPASLLRTVSCRKAVCRLDVQWTKEHATAYVSVYEQSTKLSGTELAVEPLDDDADEDAHPVQVYLTRQGYTLADLSR